MSEILLKERQQKTLIITLCGLISYSPIMFFINIIMNLFVGEGFIYDTLLSYLILLVFIVNSLLIVFKNIKKDVLVFTFALMMVYLGTSLFFEQNSEYMFTSIMDLTENPLYVLFVFSFSGYVFTRYIEDYSLLYKYMGLFSFVVVISSTLTFFIMQGGHDQPQYMVFSYNMLIHTTFLLLVGIENKKLPYLIASLLGFFIIFIAGARGPVVVLLITFIIYYFFRKGNFFKKILGIFTMGVTFYVLLMYFNSILRYISNIVNEIGFKSRTLDIITSKKFLDSSGRDLIIEKLMKNITFFGKGIYGDRVIADGLYAHNIVVEFMVQYGYLLGVILLFVIFALVLIGLTSSDKYIRNLSIIFFGAGFLKLFLSSSYLNLEPCFYMLLALGVNAIGLRKKNYTVVDWKRVNI